MLTSGGLEATKEERLGPEIIRVCFIEVGDSVVGVLRLEFLRVKQLDE